jgi:hypothetical protein
MNDPVLLDGFSPPGFMLLTARSPTCSCTIGKMHFFLDLYAYERWVISKHMFANF